MANFRAGFIAIIGRPNAGKSTLTNLLVRFPLAITSPLPQTTRHKILGIRNAKQYQLCILDTPGYLDEARDGLQRNLIKSAKSAASEDADVIVLVVEPGAPAPEDLATLKRLADRGKPLLLALNKTDLCKDSALLKQTAECYEKELQLAATHMISAATGKGVPQLLDAMVALLPESEPYYPTDQVSDRWERFFASEAVRKALFELLNKELPHACAVVIEKFKENPNGADHISALICVEKPTQKGIVVGKKGKMIREIREMALEQLRTALGRPVELELFVKVKKNWRKDPGALKDLGYTV
jgi:GTP-binding protein Era